MSIQIKEMEVDPTLAFKMLEANTHNRGLRQSQVDKYARDMKAGRWRLTHECIAFDPDGTLIDGQHRLWAVTVADKSVRFMVARGVDPDALAVINTGLSRTAVDAAKLAYGMDDVQAMDIGIARAVAAGKPSASAMTNAEAIDAYKKHKEAIAFARKVLGGRKVRGVTTVPVMAVIARAWYTQDRELLTAFGEMLVSGRLVGRRGDETVLLLRNWLLERLPSNRGGSALATTIYAKTERALSSFLLGETLSTLYAASSELFPLPGENSKKRTGEYAKRIQTRLQQKKGR